MQQGLMYLQEEIGLNKCHPIKEKMAIPIFSLINQLILALRQYLQSDLTLTWAQFLLYKKKPQTVANLVKSWVYHSKNSLELQLLRTLLLAKDQRKMKIYLRLRKYILQLSNVEMLDDITLRHEDAITIVHRMFPSSIKKQIASGIKQIFISFRVTDAKIYSCVFIEFILSVFGGADSGQQSAMAADTRNQSIGISHFSSINCFNSILHPQNGLYRKIESNPDTYTIIQTKFLPQKMQRNKTNFSYQENDSYEYSNSLNYEESKINSYLKQQMQSRKQNIQKQNNIFQFTRNAKENNLSNDHGHQIKIEETSFNQISQNLSNEFSQSRSIEGLISRNEAFKNRILAEKVFSNELNHHEEDSIQYTINIIHNSIVRNRREKQMS